LFDFFSNLLPCLTFSLSAPVVTGVAGFIQLFAVCSAWHCGGFTPALPSRSLPELILRGVQVIQPPTFLIRRVQLGKQINQELVSSEFRLYRNQEIATSIRLDSS